MAEVEFGLDFSVVWNGSKQFQQKNNPSKKNSIRKCTKMSKSKMLFKNPRPFCVAGMPGVGKGREDGDSEAGERYDEPLRLEPDCRGF